jgi:hypothetical protein
MTVHRPVSSRGRVRDIFLFAVVSSRGRVRDILLIAVAVLLSE